MRGATSVFATPLLRSQAMKETLDEVGLSATASQPQACSKAKASHD